MPKIHWSDGLHLCPEHLQAQDKFVRNYIDDLINYLEPDLWGIAHIQPQITRDKIMLNAVTARFADGMMVDYEYDNGHYQSQPPLETYFHETTAPFSVYLGSPMAGQQADRFLSIEIKPLPTELCQDQCTLETIPCLIPKLKLLISKQPANPDQTIEFEGIKYAVIEIARFEKKPTGLEINPSFIPPLLNLSANKWMFDSLKNIVAKVSRALNVQYQRVTSLKKYPLEATELTKIILLYSTLTRYWSMLTLLEPESKSAHPKKAFAILTQMHNELIAVEGGQLADNISLYNHQELFHTFNPLITTLNHSLSRLDINWVLTDLDKIGNFFKTTLKGAVLRTMKRIVLVGPAHCKISHFFWGADQQVLQKIVIQKRQRPAAELSAYYKNIEDNDERPFLREDQQLLVECNREHENWHKIKNNPLENVELWVYIESEPNSQQGWQLGILSS